MGKTWLPLEANPDVLTCYSRRLGLDENLEFHDVLALENWALEMIPSPVQSIMLLFPISEASERERRFSTSELGDASLFFVKQTIGNACGTIAVLHTLVNLHRMNKIKVDSNSYVSRMLDATMGMDPISRGSWLEKDPEIERAHIDTENEGQSAAPVREGEDVDTHFVAFILGEDQSSIIELDGRREGPVLRGECQDPCEFAARVLEVIKSVYVASNPDDIRFSILALGPTSS